VGGWPAARGTISILFSTPDVPPTAICKTSPSPAPARRRSRTPSSPQSWRQDGFAGGFGGFSGGGDGLLVRARIPAGSSDLGDDRAERNSCRGRRSPSRCLRPERHAQSSGCCGRRRVAILDHLELDADNVAERLLRQRPCLPASQRPPWHGSRQLHGGRALLAIRADSGPRPGSPTCVTPMMRKRSRLSLICWLLSAVIRSPCLKASRFSRAGPW